MTCLNTLVKRIERERLLDSVAVPLAALVHKAVGARSVRNLLSGTALGHPAHPMLTDVPIGAWTAAALLDTVGGRRGAPFADLFVAMGVAAAVPAALTGLNDWSDTQAEPGPRRVGVVHATANTTALALYTASLVARAKGKRFRGRMLGWAGYGAMSAGAYLGGHLAFAEAVNVNQTAFEDRPLGWTPVLPEADLAEGASRKAAAGNTAVLLHRRAGQVYALSATCTHMGGPLAEGQVKDGCVICPWHGSTFDLADGHVVRGPATSPEPGYETRVREGMIEVRAADSGRGPVVG
ncbi:Ferredoxin subunit of nitrite reductase or a ring-hydroxylating dioxygenase [Streptomyces sp. DvalAA-14]|uniref:Rieske (2Fe-2S) protein n=1 Tax=unclassified Streptomyces TaxID=2593676 RepID=UPI00081B5FFA|nr:MULTISPECIES: Rieske (2Fe-2S) protein [unclassified Streptomyces]MYS24242.1 Rieske 2Fe-2S domain-containing protein [Streptomyces sp. SID4948]SCE44128.1 Ferredoxin subunit of nitrite reductase or a ring-hydroxylating dioxygenase [Streptomyces sp. DvalAA-14]